MNAAINGTNVPVLFWGAQRTYEGLDQINPGPLPHDLGVGGIVSLTITADSEAANVVTLEIRR